MSGRFHSELSCPLCSWSAYDMSLLSAVAFVRDHLLTAHAGEGAEVSDALLESRFVEFWDQVVEEYPE